MKTTLSIPHELPSKSDARTDPLRFAYGERVRFVLGPLEGSVGTFVSMRAVGKMLVALGAGVYVEAYQYCVENCRSSAQTEITMIAITDTKRPALAESSSLAQGRRIWASVDDAVRCRIMDCPYSFVFDKITWQYDDGTLTLRGCVPSFYLKQMLQELLLNIEQIDRIANEVHVVSSIGLSSERPEFPRE